MNKLLFNLADFLGRPPGFYFVLVLMVISTALIPLGLTEVVTYLLSVAAIVITGVVLIQGYRDTAAIHAKLDEIIVGLDRTHNDVVGLEHEDPKVIIKTVRDVEHEPRLESGDAVRKGVVEQMGPDQGSDTRGSGGLEKSRRSSPRRHVPQMAQDGRQRRRG